MAFLTRGDVNTVVYEDEKWMIVERCKRGYLPWCTLHKRRGFLWWSWWSGMLKWGDREALESFVQRWNKWVESPVPPVA